MVCCVFAYVLICCSHLVEWNNPSQIIIKKVCPFHFVLCTFIIFFSTHDTYVKFSCYNCGHTSDFAILEKRVFAKIMQNLPPALIENFQTTHVMTTQNIVFLVQSKPSHESNSIIKKEVWHDFIYVERIFRRGGEHH